MKTFRRAVTLLWNCYRKASFHEIHVTYSIAFCEKLCESIIFCLYTIRKAILLRRSWNKPHVDIFFGSLATKHYVRKGSVIYCFFFFFFPHILQYLSYLGLLDVIFFFYICLKYEIWQEKEPKFSSITLIGTELERFFFFSSWKTPWVSGKI